MRACIDLSLNFAPYEKINSITILWAGRQDILRPVVFQVCRQPAWVILAVLAREAFSVAAEVSHSADILCSIMMVGLYYVIQEMGIFPMSVANNFCDKPLPKYLKWSRQGSKFICLQNLRSKLYLTKIFLKNSFWAHLTSTMFWQCILSPKKFFSFQTVFIFTLEDDSYKN